MADIDPMVTQQDDRSHLVAELTAVGFEDLHEIGSGGFGVVFRGRQPELDRTVAIKLLTARPDPDNAERFLREQRAMGRLSGHPNIVTIYGVGTTDSGRPYIVMEYHRRNSLEVRIRTQGPLRWEDALEVGVKVAGALETAHRMGMLHRDVKPANILLTDYGEPQLTDFGIARVAGAFETTAGEVAGSPAFTAPEVLGGQAPTRSADVYGLGATLFCAITGHAVYERQRGESLVAQFLRITRGPVPDLYEEARLPDDLAEVIERAMNRDPASRIGTAAEFGEQLRAVAQFHGLSVGTFRCRKPLTPLIPRIPPCRPTPRPVIRDIDDVSDPLGCPCRYRPHGYVRRQQAVHWWFASASCRCCGQAGGAC